MGYLACFFEGIATFVSPCLLPLLPVYVAFFAGNAGKDASGESALDTDGLNMRALVRALAFVLGFGFPFTLMGAFAGALGSLLVSYRRVLDVACGLVMVLLGLGYLDVVPVRPFAGSVRMGSWARGAGVVSAVAFGAAFAVAWTPCVGTFLASALSLAASSGSAVQGTVMLACFSLGLGVPFVLAALLIDQLEGTFAWVKAHYDVVNRVCGVMLVAVGVLTACGYLGSWLSVLAL